jgi:pimeloyl-ACP methyl ester carboxylesterase
MNGVGAAPLVKRLKSATVFVHGLWLNGFEFTPMRHRLAASHGLASHRFSYPSVGSSIGDIVERLSDFVGRIEADRINFVGHSLGGVVLCRYFERTRDAPPGRVVFLGSPTVGSQTAKNVARRALLAPLLGRVVDEELIRPCSARSWCAERELGCIAGTRPLGLGRLFSRFDEESDGTVAVSETKLPGHTAHVVLPVSHMGMLLSARVAQLAGEFLARGSFEPAR